MRSSENRSVYAKRRQRGSVYLLTVLMAVTLLGIAGLGVDVGGFYNHKRLLQTAADGAALQGGYELYRGNTGQITTAARTGSEENGYLHGNNGVNVAVYHPPISGDFVGDAEAVEVVVTQQSLLFFTALLGASAPTIPGRAVAWAGANSKSCIHVLEPNDPDAFSYNSSAVLNAPGCNLVVNSSDSWAGHLTSNAQVTVGDATFTGAYIEESSSDLSTTSGLAPQTDVLPPAPDPLAYLSPPDGGAPYSCDHVDEEYDQPVVNLSPGVYCGKFTLKNATHAMLSPGTYIFQGGPVSIEGDSVMEGDDVTLFLTEGNGYDFAPMSWSSNARADLSAPSNPNDPYFGILFYQDPAAGDPDAIHTFESSSVFNLDGTLYFPTQAVRFESSTVVNSDYLIVVVRQLIGDSNSVVNIGTNFPSGTSPLKRLALVE